MDIWHGGGSVKEGVVLCAFTQKRLTQGHLERVERVLSGGTGRVGRLGQKKAAHDTKKNFFIE